MDWPRIEPVGSGSVFRCRGKTHAPGFHSPAGGHFTFRHDGPAQGARRIPSFRRELTTSPRGKGMPCARQKRLRLRIQRLSSCGSDLTVAAAISLEIMKGSPIYWRVPPRRS